VSLPLVSCDGKLMTSCGGILLVGGCPPPPPKDICAEFALNPALALKFTWSGTLNRCTDCWVLDPWNSWNCRQAPTTLPDISGVTACSGQSAALSSNIIMDFFGNGSCEAPASSGSTSTSAVFYWYCQDGLFQLVVFSNSGLFGARMALFYTQGSNIKDGDTLGNWMGCLGSSNSLPCVGTGVGFTTGGAYKVEIVTP